MVLRGTTPNSTYNLLHIHRENLAPTDHEGNKGIAYALWLIDCKTPNRTAIIHIMNTHAPIAETWPVTNGRFLVRSEKYIK